MPPGFVIGVLLGVLIIPAAVVVYFGVKEGRAVTYYPRPSLDYGTPAPSRRRGMGSAGGGVG